MKYDDDDRGRLAGLIYETIDSIPLLHHAQFLPGHGFNVRGTVTEEGYFFLQADVFLDNLGVLFLQYLQLLLHDVIIHEAVVTEDNEESHQDEKNDQVSPDLHCHNLHLGKSIYRSLAYTLKYFFQQEILWNRSYLSDEGSLKAPDPYYGRLRKGA